MIVNFVGGRVARFSLGVVGSVRRQAQEAPALTGSVLYSTLERPGYTTSSSISVEFLVVYLNDRSIQLSQP